MGVVYEAGDEPGQVPEYICLYLVSHGLLVDARVSAERASSPTPPVGPSPPKVTAIVEA
jgi:proline-rich tail region repeat protein